MSAYCCWNSIGLISKEKCVCVCVHETMHWHACLCEAGGGVCVSSFALNAEKKNEGISCKASEKADFRVTYHANLGNWDCFTSHPQQHFVPTE